MIALSVNGKSYDVDVEPDTPLLWVLRDTIGLTGTKYGCGMGLCGSCTVHIDGHATRSCSVTVIPIGSRSRSDTWGCYCKPADCSPSGRLFPR